MPRTLQCHSRGDVRFSPFGARVRMFGRLDTIENHYQESFEDPIAAGAEFQHVEDHLPKMPRQRTFASARELVEFKRENQEADRRFEVEMAEVNREVFGG